MRVATSLDGVLPKRPHNVRAVSIERESPLVADVALAPSVVQAPRGGPSQLGGAMKGWSLQEE